MTRADCLPDPRNGADGNKSPRQPREGESEIVAPRYLNTATIYSALGIDYTTVRYDDPLARGFEYVPLARQGLYGPIDELF